jgi:eukaryotic-like serine/threonine-protein kinase
VARDERLSPEATVGLSTIAEPPPWELEDRERPTWGLAEGDAIAPGRTVLRQLGGGRRYEVFLVWDDHRLAVLVAKVLRPDQATDVAALRDLGREAEALARLAHPVIVRGFDAVTGGRYPHLLIEHLEGPTLRELIERDGALPAEQALPLGLHVASALHYLAAEGVVHLDVKPENIVMGIPPRLIDFSLVRTVERARGIQGPVGTNAYMPPEQCAPGEAGEIGPASDVWGLGATLFHSVAGELPFDPPRSTDDDAALEHRYPQLTEEPRVLPGHVPAEYRDAIYASLRPSPEDRPTAAEVALSLQPLVAALPQKVRLGRPFGR